MNNQPPPPWVTNNFSVQDPAFYGHQPSSNEPYIGGTPVMSVDAPPYLNPISFPTAPYRDAYPWQQNLNTSSPQAGPMTVSPPPEGYQRQVSTTHPPYYPPVMPETHSILNPANTAQYVKNQPSPFVDPDIYPVDRPWDEMTNYEKETKVAQDHRDKWVQNLWLDTDSLLAERQFDRVPAPNPIEGREAYQEFLFGSNSLRPNFKDKWTYLYQKYHLNP